MIRRIIEPGTPPAGSMLANIKKFTKAGISCGVNVDPIMPLINDTDTELDAVVNSSKAAGLQHVSGAIMRLRTDIWERMKIAIKLLEISDGINEYKRLYKFEEPPNSSYVMADKSYTERILGSLEQKVRMCGMSCNFPEHLKTRHVDKSHLGQTNLLNYLM